MTRPAGFALPQGNRTGPNCGITAVAAIARVPFRTVWNMIKPGKGHGWKGSTYVNDQLAALMLLGWHGQRAFVANPDRRYRMTLQRWVEAKAEPGVTYLVNVTAHVLVVKDGVCLDQEGAVPIAEYRARRWHVSTAHAVTPRTDR